MNKYFLHRLEKIRNYKLGLLFILLNSLYIEVAGQTNNININICKGNQVILNSSQSGVFLGWTPTLDIQNQNSPNTTALPQKSTQYIAKYSSESANMVQNGDFESNPISTEYILKTQTGMLNESEYCITNNPVLCHSSYASCTDHTSGLGEMMVLNGSIVANKTIWTQTIPVKPNTVYNFSVWATNTYNANVPNLQLSINYKTIGNAQHINGNNCEWQKYELTWNSDTSTIAVLSIQNLDLNSYGNDFAIDDIAFTELLIKADTINVIVDSIPNYNIGDDITACTNDKIIVDAKSGMDSYLWNTGATTQLLQTDVQGKYIVTVTKGSCVATDSITLTRTNCAGPAFKCNRMYYVSNSTNTQTQLNIVDVLSNTQVTFAPNGAGTSRYNAISYNRIDNYIYAMRESDDHVLRISADGKATDIGQVTGLPTMGNSNIFFFASDCNENGEIVLSDYNGSTVTFYSIDVQNGPPKLIKKQTISSSIAIADFAFHPQTGEIYAFDNNKHQMVKINLTTNTVTTIGTVQPKINEVVGLFFNSLGELYGYASQANSSNRNTFIGANTATGVVSIIGIGPNSSGADGCSCPYSVEMTKAVSKRKFNENEELTYTFTIYNNTKKIQTGVSFTDILHAKLVITENPSDAMGGNLLYGTGIGTNKIIINNMSIPLGESTFTIKAKPLCIEKDSLIINNQAVLSNMPEYIGNVLSDDPQTIPNLDSTMIIVYGTSPFKATATPNPVCIGGNVNLDVNAPSGIYEWTGPNGFYSTIKNPTLLTSNTNQSGYYKIKISQNECTKKDSILVTIHPLPVITATANPAIICTGQSTTLIASGAKNYVWDNGIVNSKSFSPAATKTYNVTGTDENGCSNTAQTTVTVNPLPIVNIGPNQTMCSDKKVILDAGLGMDSYIWNNGQTTHSISPSTSGTYTVTVYKLGCSTTSSASITINPLPNITVASKTICIGQTTSLIANGATKYTWDGGISNGIIFYPTETKTYSVTGTDENGCTNIKSATITVNQLPTITAYSVPPVVCAGKPSQLIAEGAATYEWSNGMINGQMFKPTETKTYTVTGTNEYGCKNTASALIKVNPTPIITTKVFPPEVCLGDSTTITASGAESYQWDDNIKNNVPYAPKYTKMYNVTGTDANGCLATANATIIVHQLPVLTITPYKFVCEYDAPFAIDFVKPSGGIYSGPGITDSLFNPKAVGSGTYTVFYNYTDSNGCKNSISQPLIVYSKPKLSFDLKDEVCWNAETIKLNGSPSGGTFLINDTLNNILNPANQTPETPITITYRFVDPFNGCGDTISKNIIIHYTPPPTINNIQTSVNNLQTSIPAIGTGIINWYDDGKLQYKLFEGNPYFHGYTSAITHSFYATQTINGCESVADTMLLKIVECGIPSPIISKTPTTKCMYDVLEPVSVSNITIGTKLATIIWRDENDNIVSNNQTFTPTYTGPGSVSYMVSLDTTNCEGAGITVTWSRHETAAPIVPAVTFSPCEGTNNPTFINTNQIGQTKWYTDNLLSNMVHTGNSFNPKETKPGTYTYWLTNNDMCISKPINVHYSINAKPQAPIITDSSYKSCEGDSIQTIIATLANNINWYDATGKLLAKNSSSFKPSKSMLKIDQTSTFYLSYNDGNCTSDKSSVAYTLYSKPSKPVLIHSNTICIGTQEAQVSSFSNDNLTWIFPELQKTYYGTTIKPEITDTGTFHYYAWSVVNGCKSDSTIDSITVGPIPQFHINGPDHVCENTSGQIYNAIPANLESDYTWKCTGNLLMYPVNAALKNSAQKVDFTTQGIYKLYVTETNKYKCSKDDSMTIRVASKNTPDFTYEIPGQNNIVYFSNTTDDLYITDGDYKELVPQIFYWNFGRTDDKTINQTWEQFLSDTTYYQYYRMGTYNIQLIGGPRDYGTCYDTIYKTINVDIKKGLFIPTAFAPSEEGPIVSVFKPAGFNLKTFKIWVYDIWGNLLWYSDKLINTRPAESWDGTSNGVIMKRDSYIWKVEAEFMDGTIWPGQEGSKTDKQNIFGNVVLIR